MPSALIPVMQEIYRRTHLHKTEDKETSSSKPAVRMADGYHEKTSNSLAVCMTN
jgi:hypothetical protein